MESGKHDMNGERKQITWKRPGRGGRGFTLMELLVCSVIFAVLVGAIYSVFSSAIRLREHAYEAIEKELPISAVSDILRRDLNCAMITTGTLALPMLGTPGGGGRMRQDQLEFYTSSGVVRDRLEEPWGDVQHVTYYLAPPMAGLGGSQDGLDLVREIDRNIFAPTPLEPTQQRLLSGVAGLSFEYYCNDIWESQWDSSMWENKAPQAVRMHLEFVQPQDNRMAIRRPLDMICEISTGVTTATQSMPTESETVTGSSSGTSSGTP